LLLSSYTQYPAIAVGDASATLLARQKAYTVCAIARNGHGAPDRDLRLHAS